MSDRRHRGLEALALAGALGAALAGAAWAAVRTPALPGEAALLAGRIGGIAGARAACALAAPALALLAWYVGGSPRWGGRGLLAAVTFVALGAPLQLVAVVHPRVLAALLVAAAGALAEPPAEGARGPVAGSVRAGLAGAALALAAETAPPAALLAAPLALALAAGLRDRAEIAALAAVAAAAVGGCWAVGGGAAWAGVGAALRAGPPGGWAAAAPRLALLVDGLALPLLLATFAIFHRDGRARAAAAIAVAAAAALAPLLSARLEDLRTTQLLALVVLAVPAAVGVAQMSETFSRGNPSRLARPFFAAATLVVAGVYGVHVLRTLAAGEPSRPAAAVSPPQPGAVLPAAMGRQAPRGAAP